MAAPTLVIVSGPAGSGKTTLAHELARAIPCPAICRDEIKEGMVHAVGDFEADWGDPLTQRTFSVFFEVLRLFLANGVTLVAEAAFQDKVWRPNLEPLAELADFRVVQCYADPDVARRRLVERGVRRAHADAQFLNALDSGETALWTTFDRVSVAAPSMDVDTTSGYVPPIEEIVGFVNRPAGPIARP